MISRLIPRVGIFLILIIGIILFLGTVLFLLAKVVVSIVDSIFDAFEGIEWQL